MSSAQPVIIIGAGPAGLSAAYKLAESGMSVHVLEAAPTVGGLARSFELWGQIVDVGPHRFFSSDSRVNSFWKNVLGREVVKIRRLTRIFYRLKYFRYPLRIRDVFHHLGIVEFILCGLSYLKARFQFGEPKNFESWVVSRFGRRLFETFFKSYTEKLWGIPCDQLDKSWAEQRIRQLSFFELIKAQLKMTGGKHRTLIEEFLYPKYGAGSVYVKMAAAIQNWGGKIDLNRKVATLLVNDGKVIGVRTADGEEILGSQVISTAPLTLMAKTLPGLSPQAREACESLRYRNTVLVYLEMDSDSLFPDNWVYIHSPDVEHGRITNFRNWSPAMWGDRKSSILCVEFWCGEKDEIWSRDDQAISELALRELKTLGLVDGVRCLNSYVLKVPRTYPIYDLGFIDKLKLIWSEIETLGNFQAIGRNGSFKYNNQDHSILMGLMAAERILTGRSDPLWDVGRDSGYQEASSIS